MWNLNAEKMALAALFAVLWPMIDAPTPSRAKAEELPPAMHVSGVVLPSVSAEPAFKAAAPCVLLRNGNVLFGVARQVGEFVVVETGEGGEIKLARQEVLCWASSVRNLYRYRVDHRQQGDLSALVRDARWCIRYDLFDLAAQEIRRIRIIDPENTQAHLIERQLRSQVAALNTITPLDQEATEATEATPDATNDAGSDSIQTVGYDDSDEESDAVHLPTLRRFASHIQPMLANRCGRCHDAANHDPEGWTLVLPTAGARASSRMTRDNLESTLRYVDPDSPEQSLLLTKATSAHGDQEAPLDARNAKAIASLRAWLWMTAASIIRPAAEDPPRIAAAPSPSSFALRAEPVSGTVDHGAGTTQHSPSDSPSGPSRLPQVDNPFDPDLFNRRFHLDSSNAK